MDLLDVLSTEIGTLHPGETTHGARDHHRNQQRARFGSTASSPVEATRTIGSFPSASSCRM
jgi:hypothetical protein